MLTVFRVYTHMCLGISACRDMQGMKTCVTISGGISKDIGLGIWRLEFEV